MAANKRKEMNEITIGKVLAVLLVMLAVIHTLPAVTESEWANLVIVILTVLWFPAGVYGVLHS